MIPDEASIGKVFCNVTPQIDFLVSIGGGTITDIVRYVATRLHIPTVSIPSAMTMDGFFTNMSLILLNGLKTTYYGDDPAIVLGDMEIIAKAPPFMNARVLVKSPRKSARNGLVRGLIIKRSFLPS